MSDRAASGVDPDVARLRSEVALSRRVGCRLGLADLAGRLSARVPGREAVLVTPGHGFDRPLRVTAGDLLMVDLEGRVLEGRPDQVPLGLELDLAIYRSRPDVQSIAAGSPPTAMAFGSVRRDVLPMTHTWAEYAHEGAEWVDPEAVVVERPLDASGLGSVGRRGFVHVPGIELLALGGEPLDTLRRLDAFEYLARLTEAATFLDPAPDVVDRDAAEAIPTQRPVERVPSRDYRRYYASLDRPAPEPVEVRWPAGDPTSVVRRDVALACRMLAAAGDLVAFFEHVSHRIPDAEDRFAMSPAKDFATMLPSDIGLVSTEGDCPAIDGPLPPAPFRWYHRDVFGARPDVGAIVHTHELLGRAFVLARAAVAAVHRFAVLGMGSQMPPVFPIPSLIFSEEHRRQTIEQLGSGPWVHAFAHGTDFCAADIATATVAAIHREEHLRFTMQARRLGAPAPIANSVVDALSAAGPSAINWWNWYSDRLAA